MANQKAVELAKKMITQAASPEELAGNLMTQFEGKSAIFQMKVLEGFEQAAIDNGMPVGGQPSLAATIMWQQQQKLGKYQKSTFPLSQKQVEVIIREVCQYK